MTTIDFITDLFCCVDDKLTQADKNQNILKPNCIRPKWLRLRYFSRSKG